jgi:putative tricarboxylic transport membrane protein
VNPTRRRLLRGLWALSPLLSFEAFGQAGESGEAECVVPAKPDGGFDLTCRLAQQMLVDHRTMRLSYLPGGIGAVAFNRIVADRRAEARTIIAFSSGSLLNLAQGKFGPYSERDVRWLAAIGTDHGVVAVRRSSPFQTLNQLLAALKADPWALTFGAGGTIGSQDWFKSALIARHAGVSGRAFRFVAFEGGGDALLALEGGHVAVFAGDAAEVTQFIGKGGGVRLLAVLSERRLTGPLANVPTAREQGVDVVWSTARGFYMGAAVSDPAFNAWQAAFRRALADERHASRLAAHGLFPLALTGPELESFVSAQMERFRRLAADFELTRR